MNETQPKKRISKQERAELRREQARRRKYWKRALWGGGTAVILIVLFSVIYLNQTPLPGEKIEVMDDQSHIPEVHSPHPPYNSDPPTSGPHVEHIAQWGVHQEALPRELLVHNLEDGGVVIYYNDQVDQETIGKLENIVKGYPEQVLVNPYPEMDNPITLTAWGRMDSLQEWDEKRITDFIEAFKGIDHHK